MFTSTATDLGVHVPLHLFHKVFKALFTQKHTCKRCYCSIIKFHDYT